MFQIWYINKKNVCTFNLNSSWHVLLSSFLYTVSLRYFGANNPNIPLQSIRKRRQFNLQWCWYLIVNANLRQFWWPNDDWKSTTKEHFSSAFEKLSCYYINSVILIDIVIWNSSFNLCRIFLVSRNQQHRMSKLGYLQKISETTFWTRL